MENPKISVIIPVYNTARNLPRCLDSVTGQTYKNMEIILIDDGSTDNSGAICEGYALRDDRIKVLHTENGGAARARNAGMAVATGDWVGFADSDDYIELDQYAYLLDLAQRHGADIAQCGTMIETEHGQSISNVPSKENCADSSHITDTIRFFANANWCRIYRREALGDIRFDPRYPIGEDLLFNLQALQRANKTAFGTKAKYHYVQHPNSICNGTPTQQALVSFREMLIEAQREFSEEDPLLHFCSRLQTRNNLDICSKIVRYGMEQENAGLIRELREELRELCKNRFAEVDFSAGEKVKAFLIAHSWPLYKRTLYALKGDSICRHPNI